jgi:hypothetical protein
LKSQIKTFKENEMKKTIAAAVICLGRDRSLANDRDCHMDWASAAIGHDDEWEAPPLQNMCEKRGLEYESVGRRLWRKMCLDCSELYRHRHGNEGDVM